MKIELVNGGAFTKISHIADEQVLFDTQQYKSTRVAQSGDIFRVVNGFIERMNHTEKAALFNLYLEAKDTFMVTRHEEDLDKRLTDIFRRLFIFVNLNNLRDYIERYSGIIIPTEVKSLYVDVEAGFTRDKTYIREEYVDLLTYTAASRFCFPIWGEYMAHVEGMATSDGKEYHAYKLLQRSALTSHPAGERLIVYVNASLVNSVETASSTLSGVGRNQIPEWLAAMVIVRKLPVIDLYFTSGKNGNIINLVFNYVKSNLNRLSKKFMDNARERKNEGGGSGDEDKEQSFIETYRAKQELSYLDLEMNIDYIEGDLVRFALDIDPSFNPAIMDAVLAVSEGLERASIHTHNHILTQWVIDSVVSTFQPDIMERRIVTRCMIVAQALLHHWGLHSLALLVTGIRVPRSNTQVLADRLMKITPEQIQKLDEIYPYTLPKAKNYGFLAVHEMASELTKYMHAVRVPQFLTVKDVKTDRYGHMQTPANITHELVGLLVKLDELS